MPKLTKAPIRKAGLLFREGDQVDLGGGVIWTMSVRAAALFSRTPRKPRRIVVPERIIGRAALEDGRVA